MCFFHTWILVIVQCALRCTISELMPLGCLFIAFASSIPETMLAIFFSLHQVNMTEIIQLLYVSSLQIFFSMSSFLVCGNACSVPENSPREGFLFF